MTNIIEIKPFEKAPTKLQNELRCRLEKAQWLEAYRAAEERNDWFRMGELNMLYCMVGKP